MTLHPLNSEEVQNALANTEASMENHGWWNKVCIHCGHSCGGRLAQYGKPTADELRFACCPNCYTPLEDYDGNQHIRLEFVPPSKGGENN